MDLYLIRHAQAVPLGHQGIDNDADRPLTEAGESQARTIAKALRQHGVNLKVIVTSPLHRARQTADAMLKDWPSPAPELLVSDELAFGGKRRKLARFVQDWSAESIALVGHKPDIESLAGWLIGSKKAAISLANAAVACIHCTDEIGKGCGTLSLLISPEWLNGTPG